MSLCHACTRDVFAAGLCRRHYQQARRRRMPTCTVDGCDRPQHARDWCETHYRRWYRHGDVNAVRAL